MYPHTALFIDGRWVDSDATLPVINPANGLEIGRVAKANQAQLDAALQAASSGFTVWKEMSARERGQILHSAAGNLSARVEQIAYLLTLEQGKPIADARAEIVGSVEVIRWFAEEGIRAYGRLIPARRAHVQQMVLKEPIGPVAAFTPWNYPVSQAVRKVAAALAAGCSIILKGDEEAPASCAAMVGAFADAGLPGGVLNLVYGVPAEISEYLIPSPIIRKISFTGSTPVGKHLSALAGAHMKRATMELGGHAPAIVCADADLAFAASMLAAHKFHNAGQVCIAPTRIMVESPAVDSFTERFLAAARALKIGDGADPATQMGPMANHRRIDAMQRLIDNATAKGARLLAGGRRIGERGFFFEPTVLADVPVDADVMNQEPFGPLAIINAFESLDVAIAEANRLPYGLAAYAFTRSQRAAAILAARVETGMMSINDYGLAYIEVPFNGIKSSGDGSEGGTEALDAYLTTKFVSQYNI